MSEATVANLSESIIINGLTRSCETLSFFLKQKVELTNINLSRNQNTLGLVLKEAIEHKDILLTTEIIGEMKGVCYFMLNMDESKFLIGKNLTDINPDDPVNKSLTEAFLLELDNIITASVITEFSNALAIKMYGGVPKILLLSEGSLKVSNINSPNMESLGFNCSYKIDGVNFSPRFIWFFEARMKELTK